MKENDSSHLIQEEERVLNRIPVEIVILSSGIAVVAALLFDLLTGIFVLTGGVFSAAGFLWTKKSFSRFFFSQEKKKIPLSLILSYTLRLVLIIATFSIIILFFSTKVFAFMVGFSTVILVFFYEALAALSRMKKWNN